MAIQNKQQPSRPRLISNALLILGGLFLVTNLLLPNLFGPKIPQVPYSVFIKQVEDGQVARASVGQNQIRYQLQGDDIQAGEVLATTPIFDLELPQRLESKGVEFAAVPPPQKSWFSNILGWVIPPLIFVGIWQFFLFIVENTAFLL